MVEEVSKEEPLEEHGSEFTPKLHALVQNADHKTVGGRTGLAHDAKIEAQGEQLIEGGFGVDRLLATLGGVSEHDARGVSGVPSRYRPTSPTR